MRKNPLLRVNIGQPRYLVNGYHPRQPTNLDGRDTIISIGRPVQSFIVSPKENKTLGRIVKFICAVDALGFVAIARQLSKCRTCHDVGHSVANVEDQDQYARR